ncbi:MAG: SecY-interacting protein [Gammaproteobacteria bacterium]|nr:SecY-interacting protein [Gammaproteobacteria bacterium]
MSEKNQISQVWQQFVDKWLELAKQNGFPEITADENWPSPCEFQQQEKTFWQPVKQDETLGFENVEHAIGYKLNDEFKTFFTLYYADNFDAKHSDGELQYLQAWSKPDFERLQQNLIGHLMMKGRLKQTPTLFFAVTDEEDLNIVVDNLTGKVALEYVGKEPHQTLANSLSAFIQQTTPVISQ